MVTLKKNPPLGTDFDVWLASLPVRWPDDKTALVRRAFEVASQWCHARGGDDEACLLERLAVADILADLRMDHEVVAAALLYEAVDRGWLDPGAARASFGEAVAQLVEGITRLDVIGDFHQQGHHHAGQLESLRKMLLAMARDVRVVLIKLAMRLHRMRNLGVVSVAEQRRLARESLDIFAPLANRLGIGQIKWELEDLALRYLDPDAYRKLAKSLDERRADREQYIAAVQEQLRRELAKAGIAAEVSGRVKHIYSIWKKMQRKNLPFEEIFDVRAVRIIVPTVADCYAVLGVVHAQWSHVRKEFDDYIANPKDNGYQSLHTAVVGPQGRTLEVQIRTEAMHQSAELGVAAHWRYKEGGATHGSAFERQISWLRQMLEWNDEDGDAGDFLDRFKAEAFQDRVYVVTPKGAIMDLPQGATPLDFAYHIHTEVGHRCRGARVNNRIVPLTYELHNGDQVDVLTAKHGLPSRDWLSPHLGYLKSPRSRSKVRHWFKQQDQDKNMAAGKAALDREFHRLDLSPKQVNLDRVAEMFNFTRPEELHAAIGHGDVNTGQVLAKVQELIMPATRQDFVPVARKAHPAQAGGGVMIRGVGKLLTQMGRCCKPAPYDPIVGFITRGRGVTIHRRDCANLFNLSGRHPERLIEVDWGEEGKATYPVDIRIDAYDRSGLLRDITSQLANDHINVLDVNSHSDQEQGVARLDLTLEINDLSQLSRTLDRLGQLPNVITARRRR